MAFLIQCRVITYAGPLVKDLPPPSGALSYEACFKAFGAVPRRQRSPLLCYRTRWLAIPHRTARVCDGVDVCMRVSMRDLCMCTTTEHGLKCIHAFRCVHTPNLA
jgi:hypothetical protein